jgi:hypothetical protein
LVEYGEKIRYIPVYVAAGSRVAFYLINVQTKVLTEICHGVLADDASLIQTCINALRYLLTVDPTIPNVNQPLFKDWMGRETTNGYMPKSLTSYSECKVLLFP